MSILWLGLAVVAFLGLTGLALMMSYRATARALMAEVKAKPGKKDDKDSPGDGPRETKGEEQ